MAPQVGGELGPFALTVRWLIQVDSLPLAVITGMLGFGLLGSAIASFVRAKKSRRDAGPGSGAPTPTGTIG